jgi:hypothetical protein
MAGWTSDSTFFSGEIATALTVEIANKLSKINRPADIDKERFIVM